jgi:hypothetical protein
VCALAAAYTHLLAPVVFLAQAFPVILQRRRNRAGFRRWLAAAALAAGLYWAWLAVLARSGGFATAYTGWIPRPELADLPLTYYVLSVGATAGWRNPLTYLSLLVYLALAVLLLRRWRELEPARRWGLAAAGWSVLGMPPVVWLASQRQSIYVDRYFVPLLPLLSLWIAAGLDVLWRRRRALAWGGLVVLLALDTWSLANLHLNPRYWRDDWRGAAAWIRAEVRPGDVLLSYAHRPFTYYSPGGLAVHDAWPMMEDPEAYAERTVPVVAGKGRLWLVLPLTVLNNHGFCEERDELARYWVDENPYVQWLLDEYSLLDTRRLPGIQVMLFGVGQRG